MKKTVLLGVALASALTLGGCGYTREERAVNGAAVGAASGALIGGLATGRWQGALIGAGAGAIGGMALTQRPSMDQYRSALYQEMATYIWRPTPIAPSTLIPGYLYFPNSVGVHSLRVTLRVDNEVQTYIVPVDAPTW